MTHIRARASSISLIASLVVMLSGPLVAAAPHEVCDGMRHGCDKIDALAECCCGDRSEANPSQVPSGRVDVASSPHAVAAIAVTFEMPAVTVLFAREGLPLLSQPHDLRILFSDLRI